MLMKRAFNILVCPEFYISMQPRLYELHEITKMHFCFTIIKNHSKTQKVLKENANIVRLINESRIKEKFLIFWKNQTMQHHLDATVT